MILGGIERATLIRGIDSKVDKLSSIGAVRKRLYSLDKGEKNLSRQGQEASNNLAGLEKTEGIERDEYLKDLLIKSQAVSNGIGRVRYERVQIRERHPIKSRIAGFLNYFYKMVDKS